jgi:multicomponent Na+:H+ antiporter subunit C
MSFTLENLASNYSYVVVVILLMLGFWAMISKRNLVKKCVGMSIFQTAIILFYISMGAKKGSTIPIIEHGHGEVAHAIHAADYANPLTQILMLTAIVVGVATLGIALTLIQKIYKEYGTTEEDELMGKLK